MIEGLLITPLRRIAAVKGDVMHAIKCTAPGFSKFGEAYFSWVLPGATKGWKRHRRVTLNLVVPVGSVEFGIVDARDDSPSRGRGGRVLLGESNYARLTVAPGLWVAFRGVATSASLLLNVTDEEHDPDEADNADLDMMAFPAELLR